MLHLRSTSVADTAAIGAALAHLCKVGDVVVLAGEISLASAIRGLGPTQFGTLLAMSGLGLALGAVAVAQLGHGINRRLLASAGLGTIAWSLVLLGQMRGTSGALAWAIGCGRAVITSDARSFAEEISHGNGLAYKQGQVGQLAQALYELLVDPSKLIEWTRAAGRVAEARQWDRTGHAFAGHFQQVVQRRGKARARAGLPVANRGQA